MNNHPIIIYPLATEKSIRLMESENKLIFIVGIQSTKPQIKQALEEEFKVKIDKVRTLIDTKGRKKAYVTFSPETPAIDVATKLGLM
jgi:ribosomal protein uL23